MIKQHSFRLTLIAMLAFFIANDTRAQQIIVTGPTCVMAGTPYLYSSEEELTRNSLQSCVAAAFSLILPNHA
jgi:hypothetical protein